MVRIMKKKCLALFIVLSLLLNISVYAFADDTTYAADVDPEVSSEYQEVQSNSDPISVDTINETELPYAQDTQVVIANDYSEDTVSDDFVPVNENTGYPEDAASVDPYYLSSEQPGSSLFFPSEEEKSISDEFDNSSSRSLSEEDTDNNGQFEEIILETDEFSAGYVLISKDTVAYSDPFSMTVDGFFSEDSIVYAEKNDGPEENGTEWLRIIFDTEEKRTAGQECSFLYIPATSAIAISEEESAILVDELSAENETRYYQDYLLPTASYMNLVARESTDPEEEENKETITAEGENQVKKVFSEPANAGVDAKSTNTGFATAIEITDYSIAPSNEKIWYSGTLDSSVDALVYSITLPASGYLEISGNTTLTDVFYRIYNPNKHQVASVLKSQTNTASNAISCGWHLKKGTYYILFLKYQNYTGSINFQVMYEGASESFSDSGQDDSMSGANSIAVNTDYVGHIGLAGDVDYYRFTLPSAGSVALELNAFNGSVKYEIFDSSGTLQTGYNKTSYTYRFEQLFEKYDLAKGLYYLKISSGGEHYTDAGNYGFYLGYINIKQHPSGTTVNVGTNVNFSVVATGAFLTYQWQFRNAGSSVWNDSGLEGSDTSTLTVPAISQRAGLYYRCMIKDVRGNIAYTNAARLNINLTITKQPQNAVGQIGNTVSFAVEAAGNQLSYRWQYRAPGSTAWQNSGIETSCSKTFKVPVIAGRNNMSYRCVITDEFGNTTTSNVVVLTINLKIIQQPASISTTAGKTVKFYVGATGSGLKYQWQYRPWNASTWNNSGLAGSNTNTLTVNASSSNNGMYYRCIVSSGSSRVASDQALLKVQTAQNSGPVITKQPSNAFAYIDETATFHVDVSGENIDDYQWQYLIYGQKTWKDSNLTGSHFDTLKVPVTAARNRMSFRCIITNTSGKSVVSSSATLYTKINILIETFGWYRCNEDGEMTTLSLDATGTGLSYQWQYLAPGSSQWRNSECEGSHSSRLFFKNSFQRFYTLFRCVVKDCNGNMVVSKPVEHPDFYGTFGYANIPIT